MEEENQKKFKWDWIYLAYSPYIILMAIAYAIGVSIASFQAFVMYFYNKEEYYNVFKTNEAFLRKILLSMFDS